MSRRLRGADRPSRDRDAAGRKGVTTTCGLGLRLGIVNQHLTYAVVTFGLGVIGRAHYYGRMIARNFPSAVRRLLLSGNPDEPTAVAA